MRAIIIHVCSDWWHSSLNASMTCAVIWMEYSLFQHTHTHICTCIHWCMQMPLHMHSSILKTCMHTQMHTNPQLTSLNLCLTNLSIQSMTITLWAHVLARTITAHTHYIWDVWIEINQIRKIVTGASASGTKLGLQARTDPTAENAY